MREKEILTRIILLILAIVIIAVIIIKKNQDDAIDSAVEEIKEIKEIKDSIPKVLYSKNLEVKELETKKIGEHEIKRICLDKSDVFVWKCPNCEVENRSTNKRCYVCKHNI